MALNFFVKATPPVDDISSKVHKYTVDWTPDRIEWSVDGTVQRILTASQVGARFPSSPTHVKLGAWIAGHDDNDPDTITLRWCA
ncbi:Glycoside hydrolase, family 16 [Akanthomyces lecanii RCEF 1005]|uniref:Glycoside hydrolase, family 16 n=1 Tax=Akanthomyces lecanii RCEF 1005 TaxID=1081108 RepID=A0A168BGD8_CORDF|nr:Glycoside hydrolase, family 16 [Akanthomyces lecanii RCEF 1005]